MTRIVFDTNALISSLLFRNSTPGNAFDRALSIGTVLVSDALILELRRVLNRRKFDRYITQNERDQFITALVFATELVEVIHHVQACSDPDDDMILALAICGTAEYIVTGDSDLLSMNPFRGVQIITPSQFMSSTHPTAEATQGRPV